MQILWTIPYSLYFINVLLRFLFASIVTPFAVACAAICFYCLYLNYLPYIDTHTHSHTDTQTHTLTHSHTLSNTHTDTHSYTDTHIHTQTHTLTLTHTHTHSLLSLPLQFDHFNPSIPLSPSIRRLLPYLLDLITDDTPTVSTSALSVLSFCGQQYEEEHPDEIIERRQYGVDGDNNINLSKALPFPFTERPRIGKYVCTHAYIIFF